MVSSAQRLLWRRRDGELVYALRHRGEEASPAGLTPVEPIQWTAAGVRGLGHRVSGVASMDGEHMPAGKREETGGFPAWLGMTRTGNEVLDITGCRHHLSESHGRLG
jgi:hypothetical protein